MRADTHLDPENRTLPFGASAMISRQRLVDLGRRFGDDAVQDVLAGLVERSRSTDSPDGQGVTIHDPRAADPDHATARFVIAVRQRSRRQDQRTQASGDRLYRFLTDPSTDTSVSVEDLVLATAPSVASPELGAELARLDAVTRSALMRHVLDGVPFDELARQEGVAAATLRQRCHRARTQLADRLKSDRAA